MNTDANVHSVTASVSVLDRFPLADLGRGTALGTQAEVEPQLLSALAALRVDSDHEPLARAALLLWLGHLDPAHAIAQEQPSADGSLLHGIVHRREPDYANAKYWFRRAGAHVCYPALADAARALPGAPQPAELRWFRGDAWDPLGFVDACERACQGRDERQIEFLRQIQRLEMGAFLAQLPRS